MVNFTMLIHNRPRLTKQALSSIGDHSDLHSTVLLHRCDEETKRTVALECASGFDRLILVDTEKGTGPLRNQVIEESRADGNQKEYLYTGDNDVYFTRPDWLKVLVGAYIMARHYGYKILGAYNHPFNGPISAHQGLRLLYGSASDPKTENFDVYPVYAVATQSMLMSWDVWDEFGPFCDTPAGKVCQSEDVDFCNRIRAAGYKVGVICPALLVNTGITNSFGEKIPGWELVKSQCPEGVICE